MPDGIDWKFIANEEGEKKLKDYVPLPKTSKSGVTISTLYASEYMICDALEILKNNAANNAAAKKFPAMNYGREIYNRLDIGNLPSSLVEGVSEKPVFLKNKLKKTKITKYKIESDTKQWFFAVEIVAEFNSGGARNLILYVVDQAKEGNYRSYSTWLVINAEKSGAMKAETR